MLQEQIDEVVNGIIELKAARAENFSVKCLEKTKKSLEGRLKKLNDEKRKDDVVTFDSYIIRLNRKTCITKGFLLSLICVLESFNKEIFKNA